jgi:hypothetical protein
MADANQRDRTGVRGWLLVLCGLLLVWHPLDFALVASGALEALPRRGVALALVLLLRLIVTALGIAAGIALLARRPAAVGLAIAALLSSAAVDLFVYTTPFFPNNRMPGDTPWYIAASLAYHAAWIVYLVCSRRVRNTY